MSLRAVWTNVRKQQRYHGSAAAARLLALAAARRAMVLERSYIYGLGALPEAAQLLPGRAVRPAEIHELCELAADPVFDMADFTADEMRRRFEAGHECAVSTVDGMICGYAWMAPSWLEVNRCAVAFALEGHEAHIYKGFTHPRFRGQRFGHDRINFWRHRLLALDKTAIVTDFSFDNPATLTRARNLDMDLVGSITLIELGPIRRLMCSGDLEHRRRRSLDVAVAAAAGKAR